VKTGSDPINLLGPPAEAILPVMDKRTLVDQLVSQLQSSARAALSARDAAAAEARDGATPDEKREDARAAHQLHSFGKASQGRAKQALADADMLATFRPGKLAGRIALGAIVEIEDAESGEGRTFFLAPVGAGVTLTGPGGDGHLSVVTPVSPIGKAVIGKRTGDVVDVTVDGDIHEWQITYVE
jgi:transcription elongation GreA/GreB family factor